MTGAFWFPYVLCKTAGKCIHVLHINMPKCQESPLSMKTISNTKEKCLASSLVNADLSEKLSVEIRQSQLSTAWGNTHCNGYSNAVPSQLKHYIFLPCRSAFGMNTNWVQNWMTLKVNFSFTVDFSKPPSKDIELKLSKLYWTICEPVDYLSTDFHFAYVYLLTFIIFGVCFWIVLLGFTTF